MRGIFFIFCRSRYINNFVKQEQFFTTVNHQKLNLEINLFLQNFVHRLENLIYINKLEKYIFQKGFFQELEAFFHECKIINLGTIFSTKNDFILFLRCNYLIVT